MTDYVIKPLDATTWDAFARLVERHNGVFGGCWCTWFHTFQAEKTFTAEGNRALKERLVEEGRAHAALVFDGDEAVAWCQYGTPEELPNIHPPQGVRGRSRQPARLPDHLHLRGQEVPAQRSDGGRSSWCRGSDCAGRRRGRGGVPARHRRPKGVRALQRHAVPVRAGRLQLPPAQGQEELRDAQGRRGARRSRVEELLAEGRSAPRDEIVAGALTT
jgi:hypothetical protein